MNEAALLIALSLITLAGCVVIVLDKLVTADPDSEDWPA